MMATIGTSDIREMHLRSNLLGPKSARFLAAHLGRFESLHLNQNRLSDDGAISIAMGSYREPTPDASAAAAFHAAPDPSTVLTHRHV